MSAFSPTNYTLTVWANRRPENTEPVTWQARAEWGHPEQQVVGEPKGSECAAADDAVRAMKEKVAILIAALETGAFV